MIQSDIQETLIKAVEKMPAFPQSVHKVLTLASDINCPQRELVEAIKNDPVFTLKILKLVNSPYFGLSKEITSVNQASVYLGLNTLKNVALGLAAMGALPRKNKAGFDMTAFWLHSLATAAISKKLASLLDVPHEESADYFAAGILHDVGKGVFALHLPDEFGRAMALSMENDVPLYKAEKGVIGATHNEIGAVLAKKWQLPDKLIQTIALHHSAAPTMPLIVQCVAAANEIAKRLEYGFAGDPVLQELSPSLSERFNTDMDGLIGQLQDIDTELEAARSFIQFGDHA